MSVNLFNDVMKGSPHTGGMFAVFLVLADNADDGTGYCYPAVDYIAWKSRQSERSVQYCLKRLADEKWLRRSIGTGPNGCNEYWLNTPRMKAAAVEREKVFREDRARRRSTRLAPPNPFQEDLDRGATIAPALEDEANKGVQPLHPKGATIAPPGCNHCTPGVQIDASQDAIALHPNHQRTLKTNTPRHAARSPGGSAASPEQPQARRDAVRNAVQNAQRAKLGAVVWPPGADRALLAMLRDYPEPDWPADRLLVCVANRFASAQDPAQPPQRWIRDLPRYISGPKDRFDLVDTAKSQYGQRRAAPTDFATAAPLVNAKEPPAAQLADSVRSRIKQRLRELADPSTRDAWLGPLVFSYIGKSNRVIVLAPSTEWKGFQEKFGDKISDTLKEMGLTGDHEMWYFTPKGEWIRPT